MVLYLINICMYQKLYIIFIKKSSQTKNTLEDFFDLKDLKLTLILLDLVLDWISLKSDARKKNIYITRYFQILHRRVLKF